MKGIQVTDFLINNAEIVVRKITLKKKVTITQM